MLHCTAYVLERKWSRDVTRDSFLAGNIPLKETWSTLPLLASLKLGKYRNTILASKEMLILFPISIKYEAITVTNGA